MGFFVLWTFAFFISGNGRHARLIADLMMFYAKHERFTWGGHKPIDAEGQTRDQYLRALRKADAEIYNDLIQFALAD